MIIVLLIIIDQLSKWFANMYKPSFDVIGDFLQIQYTENTGTIFGLMQNTNAIFIVLGIVLCVFIGIYMKYKVPRESTIEKCFILILAGGVGNIIDRIFRGFVVDFISLKWVGIFNFADSYIVLGVLFIIFMEIREIFKDGEADKKSDFTSWWI